MSNPQGFGENIYEDAGQFGLFKVKIIFYIGVILAVCLVLSGIMLVLSKEEMLTTKATVVSSNCKEYHTKYGTYHNCMVNVKYNVDGQELTGKVSYQTTVPPVEESEIDIRYNPTNPKIITTGMSNRSYGFIASCIALIIVIVVSIQYYFASSFKIYRAGEGFGTFLGLLTAPFRYY